MKKLFSFLAAFALLTLTTHSLAQTGATCDDAIYVEAEYNCTFSAGEYWFMALTSALPMTINCYPAVNSAQQPEIQIDFTCEYDANGKGIYDDPKVAKMVANASYYGLSLPMTYKLSPSLDDNGKLVYSYTFPKNYQNMLYGQGVTNAIPAFVRLKVYSSTSVEIASGSVNTRCRDYVNQLSMNTTLLFSPEDSVNAYVWPIGEWLKYKYEITWTGKNESSSLYFITSKDCEFDRFSGKIRDRYYLPAVDEAHELKMTPEASSDLVEELFQTELYVRLYATTEGYLKISTYEDNDNLTDYIVGGVAAVVDNEEMTITAVLPAGTDRSAAIKAAKYRPLETHDGHTPEYDGSYMTLTFGKLKYDLSGITVSKKTGDTDASLKAININDIALPDFSPAVLDYTDIEVVSGLPVITATARKTTSNVEIQNVTAIPGTATITVTAEAGNQQVYTVSFIKQRSKDNTLKALYVDGQLVPDFSRDTYHYRMEVMNMPVITAEVNDSLASMVIDQCKRVPGFGQVIVTAESGQKEVYTINFVLNPAIESCSKESDTLKLSVPFELSGKGDEIGSVPFGKQLLVNDSLTWAGRGLTFTYSGQKDLTVYIASTCMKDKSKLGSTLVDSLSLALPKGFDKRIVYVNPKTTTAWGKKSIDGSLYLLFSQTDENGELLIEENEGTECKLISTFIDINQTVYFPQGNNSTDVYKFYLPDWKDKQVNISWEGQYNMMMWTGTQCQYNLTTKDQNVIDVITFTATDSKKIESKQIADWIVRCKALGEKGDFMYIRFQTDGMPGTLKTEQVGGAVTRSDALPKEPTLTWYRSADGIRITSLVNQHVQVYTLQGILVLERQMSKDETVMLPHGMYIVRGETETGKTF